MEAKAAFLWFANCVGTKLTPNMYVWQTPGTAQYLLTPSLYLSMVVAAGIGKLVRAEERINATKYQNLLQNAAD